MKVRNDNECKIAAEVELKFSATLNKYSTAEELKGELSSWHAADDCHELYQVISV